MDFDILIATRNRQKSLELSLPLMLSQSRLPRQVIVVDSSDDPDKTRKILSQISASTFSGVDLQLYQTEAGTAYQRNFGLKKVQSPVVLMPDDDSLWFPGVAESLMRIYERDNDGIIGGVGAEESYAPPPGRRPSPDGKKDDTELGQKKQRHDFISKTFNRVEYALFPDPLFVEAFDRYRNRSRPAWLGNYGAVFSATMTGFRMSFRTEAIRNIGGFDEILGRYALFEDHDACLGVLNTYAIARAKNALVFHQTSSAQRAAPEELGIMHILNRAYITYKHSPVGSAARLRLPRFCLYKLLRYLSRVYTARGRSRFLGALKAFSLMSRLNGPSGQELQECYAVLRNQCLSGINSKPLRTS